MSLRTNVCPVDVRERALVRCWTTAERKTRDMKESILGVGEEQDSDGREILAKRKKENKEKKKMERKICY